MTTDDLAAMTRADRRAARLDDPRMEGFRTPRARRALVVAMVALLAVETVAFVLIEVIPIGTVAIVAVVLLAFVFCLGALKASTRGIEELPPDVLDERQQQMRGIVYARAYKIGAGLLILALFAALIWTQVSTALPPAGVLVAAGVVGLHITIVLPTMVAAWVRHL
jgi:hypothetical protein